MKINRTKIQILKIIFRGLFLGIALISLWFYLDYKKSANNVLHINHEYTQRKINRGGRGANYEMKIYYEKKYHTISLTKTEYESIGNNIFPNLYYSEKTDTVFSNWEIKISLRIMILFFSLFLFSFIPINKVFLFISKT